MGNTEKEMNLLPITLCIFLTICHSFTLRCPEYGRDLRGDDIVYVEDIKTWQDCGKLCMEYSICTHWSWLHHGADFAPGRCYLKQGEGILEKNFENISGHQNCTSDCI